MKYLRRSQITFFLLVVSVTFSGCTPEIERYDKLNLNDLNSIIATVLENVSSITGRDYNQLKLQVAAVNNAINQDETLKTFANGLLEQVGGAVNDRGVPVEQRTSQEIRQMEIKLIGSRQ